jgi:hypothetical protein
MKIYAEISLFSGQSGDGTLIPAAWTGVALAWPVLRMNPPGASTPGADGGTGRRRT